MNILLSIAVAFFGVPPYFPNLEPTAIEMSLEGLNATQELKHFRVVIEEQSEQLKEEQGNGGYLLPIRVEDKRSGEVQRTVVMGFILLVKDMGEDPPELFSWSRYSAGGKTFCRTQLSHGTCETWCDDYQDRGEGLKRSDQPRSHFKDKCDRDFY